MTHIHPLLPDNWDFKEETFTEAIDRYSGFGEKMFFELDSHFPGMLSKFRFFQPQQYQQEDIWAIYQDNTFQFAVQLEPSCEVIILWNDNPKDSIEIGTWWDDEYEAAIAFIEEVFFKKEPSGKFSFN